MPLNPSDDDPIATHSRRAVAQRRVGVDARCGCGETRPEALIVGSKPMICAECQRREQGKPTTDHHHVAGRANCDLTIPVPANDHRAILSEAQRCWPKETLQNPLGSPLLAAAATIRGFADTLQYLIEKCLLWPARLLEWLDSLLAKVLGPRWWRKPGMEPPPGVSGER